VAHGKLAADAGNGVLVTHGYTGGPSTLAPGARRTPAATPLSAATCWAPRLAATAGADADLTLAPTFE